MTNTLADSKYLAFFRRKLNWRPFWLTILSALLLYASFPPIDFGPVAFFAIIPFFLALREVNGWFRVFWLGYLLGIVYFGGSIYWIGSTVAAYIHNPLGWVAWVALTLIKSLWFGFSGVAIHQILGRTQGFPSAIAISATWAFYEWCRSLTSLAMPWSFVGYSQYRFLPFIQISDIFGVYGVSFVVVLVNITLFRIYVNKKSHADQPFVWKPALPTFVIFALTLGYGMVRLQDPWSGKPVRITAMQTNDKSVGQLVQPPLEERIRNANSTMIRYRKLVEGAASSKPQLVIWPESTAPFSAINNEDIRAGFGDLAKKLSAYEVVGTDYRDPSERSFNAAAVFDPEGQLIARYDKNQLVPMGEWVPFRRFIPFGDFFHLPDDSTPGPPDQIISAGPFQLCTLICFESAFSRLAADRTKAGANLIVCLTNDSWSGQVAMQQQHYILAVFRAIENRRWVVCSATTGMTGFVSPAGKMDRMEPYKEGSLTANAALRTDRTTYANIGDLLPIFCGLAMVGFGYKKTIPSEKSEAK